MKKQVFTLIILFITISMSFGQLSFYSNGKKVETANCETNDLKVNIVLPELTGNYDALKIKVKLAPNSSLVSLFNYEVDLQKDVTKGKKEISLRLKSSQNVSDFYAYGQQVPNVLEGPCMNKARSEQYYTLSFQVLGMKLTGYKMKIINNETKNIAQYSTVVIKEYPDAFKMDFGKVSSQFVSTSGKFSLKRYSEEELTVQESASSPIQLAGQKKAQDFSYIFTGNDDNNDDLVLYIQLFEKSQQDVSKTQEDMINAFKRYANHYLLSDQRKFAKNDWDKWANWSEATYPGFILHLGKSGNKDFDKKMKELTKKEVVWEDKKIGNLDCKYLELDCYYDWEVSKDASYRAFVSKDYQNSPRKLILFVGEKNGTIYAGSMFKIGKDSKLTDKEQKFWDEILNSFTAL